MSYFLDTNTCIYFLKNKDRLFLDKFNSVKAGDIKIPSVVAAELHYGALKSARVSENAAKVSEFIALYEVVSFDNKSAEIYGEIRSKLESAGNIIGGNDLLIAATVLASNGILVTHNTKEFNRVVGLKLEDWAQNV